MTTTTRITEAQRRLLVSACRRETRRLFETDSPPGGERRTVSALLAKGLVEGSLDAQADLRVAEAAYDLLKLEKPARPAVMPSAPLEQTDAKVTKRDVVLERLRASDGAAIAELQEATGWQPHSVRGFLSGTVRKSLGLNLVSFVGDDGERRYRTEETANA